jgi:hypothetical protein
MLHFPEYFLGSAETVDGGRHSAVHSDLHEYLSEFILGPSIIQGAPYMRLELSRTPKRGDHAKVQH